MTRIAVLLAVAVMAGCASDSAKPTSAPAVTAAPSTVATPRPSPSFVPDVAYFEPDKDDFTLTIRILEKKCFGSAGCNVTFRIKVGYDGDPLDPEKTYEVTYAVRGGEDTLTNTLTVTGDDYVAESSEYIGTASAGSKIRAVVTRVEER